jgi:hypothetical protein
MEEVIRITLQSSQSLSKALGSLESNDSIVRLQEKLKYFETFAEKGNELPAITDIAELDPPVRLYGKGCTAFRVQIASSLEKLDDWWAEYQDKLEVHMNPLRIVLWKIFT